MGASQLQFALEVAKACVDAIGADRVGIRLSPFHRWMDATDSTPYATYV
jgi:2,4-dienoyl-CoA reductase-like NADH-dependent reductase (Old Yellow Enzyme family)